MRHFLLLLISACAFSFTNVVSAQEEITTKATFKGFDGVSYIFTTVATKDVPSKTISFIDIDEDISKTYDLSSKAFKGESFLITYMVAMQSLEATDGSREDIETFTLVALKK